MMLLLQCLHTVRAPPILLYRHYSPDQLISRTRGPITRDLSVHGDPNVNPKWNNMSAISWTSMHTASNRSTALPKLWQSFFLSQMRAKLQTPAMESGDGKFCGCADGDWTCVCSFLGRCAKLHHSTLVPSVSNMLVPIIHGRWCCNMMLLLQCLHTLRAPPILL